MIALAAASLDVWDWTVIGGFTAASIAVGVWFTRRASRSTEEFFISGRKLPWWLAGTSIVATTFAADTPLAISGIVRQHGLWANWWWWCLAINGVLGAALLARLWRRSEAITDVGFVRLRYGGRAMHVLQVFRVFFFGVFFNAFVLAWVFHAMGKIFDICLTPEMAELKGVLANWAAAGGPSIDSKVVIIAALMLLSGAYAISGGFWGVVATDLIQFVVAMGGSITLAVFSVQHAAAAAGGVDRVFAAAAHVQPQALEVIPEPSAPGLVFFAFLFYMTNMWWNHKSADSGGYIAQRLLACKNENHALGAGLWYNFAHIALRSWPWVIVGLASLVLWPDVHAAGMKNHEDAYPRMIMLMPSGLRGLLVGSLLAAFMSTVDTHLNWGASYLTTDFYQRYLRPACGRREGVAVSRLAMVLLMLIGGVAAYYTDSVFGMWKFVALLGAGSGAVMVLRWFWWRINAYSEIVVLGTSGLLACAMHLIRVTCPGIVADPVYGFWWQTPYDLAIVAGISLSLSIWVTLRTRPTPTERLVGFYRKVRPGGPGWGPIAQLCPDVKPESLARPLLCWLVGCVFVFASMFGLGILLLGELRVAGHPMGPPVGWMFIAIAAASAAGFFVLYPRAARPLAEAPTSEKTA